MWKTCLGKPTDKDTSFQDFARVLLDGSAGYHDALYRVEGDDLVPFVQAVLRDDDNDIADCCVRLLYGEKGVVMWLKQRFPNMPLDRLAVVWEARSHRFFYFFSVFILFFLFYYLLFILRFPAATDSSLLTATRVTPLLQQSTKLSVIVATSALVLPPASGLFCLLQA